MSRDALKLFDTTLRDGTEDGRFRPDDKRRAEIADCLVRAGFDVIELFAVGDPGLAAACELAGQLGAARACVLARATAGELGEALRVLESAENRRIHLYADLSRKTGVAEALEGIWAARTNLDEVEFSPLRAFEIDETELLEQVLATVDSGATHVNLSDTTGGATPDRVAALFTTLRDRLDGEIPLSFHGHDDTGLAVANALAACRSGASQVHVCLEGLGPRGGNTPAQAFLDALAAAPDLAPRAPRLRTSALAKAEALVRASLR